MVDAMFNIFINGLKSKTGGGKSILNNYLSLLKDTKENNQYFVITPNRNEYEKYRCEHISIIDVNVFYKNNVLFPFVNHFLFPKLLNDLKIDLLFNMGDIVVPTRIPQLYLFDWAYAIYPESIAWERMDAISYLNRRIKLYFFRKYIKCATDVIAQTNTARERLKSIYGLSNIKIVPNAVSLENLGGGVWKDFNLPVGKTKLLYLTYYYPHKNLEIFLPLAREIKKKSLPYCLVITIEATQHKEASRFLEIVSKENLNDIIINTGPVAMANVPSLYSQCDALLMPTLLESFSGTYVEAMYHQKSILTSNIDFAKDVCGDAAFYFNPLDADSILDSLKTCFGDNATRKRRIEEGKKRLAHLLNWEQAFEKYQTIIAERLHHS